MKRQAAITGPTPPMIQWTLMVDCTVRDLTKMPPAIAASRQLRGLLEWSRAKSERRIRNGICLHENCDSKSESESGKMPNEWMGFPEAEPFTVFGGQLRVLETCGNCPANVCGNDVAGCWGVIPFAGPDWDCDQVKELHLGTGQRLAVTDLPGWFERLLERNDLKTRFNDLFPVTSPRWYGIWIGSEWSPEQVDWMAEFLESNRAEIPTEEISRLAAATVAAREHRLRICFDRMAAGNSDSVAWTLQLHCGRCGWPQNTRSHCACCGEHRAPMPEQRKKVMGLRPWLRLDQLYGPDEAARIVEDYQQS